MVDFAGDDVFNQEDVDSIVKTAISTVLTDVMCVLSPASPAATPPYTASPTRRFRRAHTLRYNPDKVNSWINSVVDSCLKELQGLNRPFKYVGPSLFVLDALWKRAVLL